MDLTVSALTAEFERNSAEDAPPIPRLDLRWHALKAYVLSFGTSKTDFSSLLKPVRDLVKSGEEEKFDQARTVILNKLALHVDKIERTKTQLFTYG